MAGKHDLKIAELKNEIAASPGKAELYVELGLVCYAAKNPQDALAAFDKAIELAPAQAASHNNRGIMLSALKRYAEAAESFNKAIDLDPAYAGAYNNLGVALAADGRLDDAVGAYRKAVELAPEFAHALRNLCKGLEEQKKLPEAIAAYRALEAVTWRQLWKDHNLEPDTVLPGMIAECRDVLQTHPDDTAHLVFLGRALLHENKAAEAVGLFQKVIEAEKDNSDAHYLLAIALIESKARSGPEN